MNSVVMFHFTIKIEVKIVSNALLIAPLKTFP